VKERGSPDPASCAALGAGLLTPPQTWDGRIRLPAVIATNSRRGGRRRRRQQRRQKFPTRRFQRHFTRPYTCLSPSRARGQKPDPNALIQRAAGFAPAVSTRAPYGTLARKSPERERQAAAGARAFETVEGHRCLAARPSPRSPQGQGSQTPGICARRGSPAPTANLGWTHPATSGRRRIHAMEGVADDGSSVGRDSPLDSFKDTSPDPTAAPSRARGTKPSPHAVPERGLVPPRATPPRPVCKERLPLLG